MQISSILQCKQNLFQAVCGFASATLSGLCIFFISCYQSEQIYVFPAIGKQVTVVVTFYRVCDLLQSGAVMNKSYQPHEGHIPYLLQLFIDYNLYGMNLLNLAAVKFRRGRKIGMKL